jgi:hypothetical protein
VIAPSNEDNILSGERELRTKVSASAARSEDCDPHVEPPTDVSRGQLEVRPANYIKE